MFFDASGEAEFVDQAEVSANSRLEGLEVAYTLT